MKNLILIAACLVILPIDSIAQWSGPTNGWLSTSNSVSISQAGGMAGTPGTVFSPLLSLSLTGLPTTGPGSVTGGTLFPLHVTYQGRVGIGTNNPLAGLHVATNLLMTRPNGTNVMQVNPVGLFRLTTDGFNNTARGFYINDGTLDFFSITESQLLFKSPTAELFKINANGHAYARKMVVTLANPFPDYVFEKEYKLMPLTDLAAFIAKNKHLPNLPSAQQVADNNNQVELGEMQALLLEKVEELTLYILQQQQQIEELQRKLADKQ